MVLSVSLIEKNRGLRVSSAWKIHCKLLLEFNQLFFHYCPGLPSFRAKLGLGVRHLWGPDDWQVTLQHLASFFF